MSPFARFTVSSNATFSAMFFSSLFSLLVGSHFSASFYGAFGRGMVTKKEPAGMIIALDFLKPNFFWGSHSSSLIDFNNGYRIPSIIIYTRNQKIHPK